MLGDPVGVLAENVVKVYLNSPKDKRILVAIAGIPGSGKSTLAYPLTHRINTLLLDPARGLTTESSAVWDGNSSPPMPADGVIPPFGQEGDVAICVGLDGWHYSRAELDDFPNPAEAHWRRGAAFTFNLPSYRAFLDLLQDPSHTAPIPFPTFSHALKDPLPSVLPILPSHRIILIEGLYTLYDSPGWRECAEMMDTRVWVDVPREIARERVIKRNWEAGIVQDLQKCIERVDASDMINADEVEAHKSAPTDIFAYVEGSPEGAHRGAQV